MHIQLAAILNRQFENAVLKFSQLPFKTTPFTYNLYDQILTYSGRMIRTYLDFLNAVNFIPNKNYGCYRTQIIIYHDNDGNFKTENAVDQDTFKAIEQTIIPIISKLGTTKRKDINPLYCHYRSHSGILVMAGVTITNGNDPEATSLLHQFGVCPSIIEINAYKSDYLIKMLADYQKDENISVPELAAKYGKSYRQFQKECRLYFGTTFHSLSLKIKMLNIIDDLMFTDLSLKEIAYKYEFSEYSNMYRLFNKQYGFPIQMVPRFLQLI